jgi:hypothetical protein
LRKGKAPSYGPLYSLNARELDTLKKWLHDSLAKGHIRPSTSSAASPILFAKKKDGSLRLCVDYRALNSITQRDRGPLPRIDQLMQQISGARYLSKIDLRSAYNLVRVAEGDEWKTAFRTHFGLYETLVMPFGLTNAPPVFQRFISEVLGDLFATTCVVYLDDILIFSKDRDSHTRDVCDVLDRLRANELYASFDKCVFYQNEVEFLGYIVSGTRFRMDPAKLTAMQDWPAPKSVKDVQRFLGYINFYRKFIPRFASLAYSVDGQGISGDSEGAPREKPLPRLADNSAGQKSAWSCILLAVLG